MRNGVKWRKQSRIIMLLAEQLGIPVEQALDEFYKTETYKLFSNPDTGLELMSDLYILEDLLKELQTAKPTE